MELCIDEKTGKFKEHKEPFCTVEFPTKEDYDRFVEMVNFWNEHHKEQE